MHKAAGFSQIKHNSLAGYCVLLFFLTCSPPFLPKNKEIIIEFLLYLIIYCVSFHCIMTRNFWTDDEQCLYGANECEHADFVYIW